MRVGYWSKEPPFAGASAILYPAVDIHQTPLSLHRDPRSSRANVTSVKTPQLSETVS